MECNAVMRWWESWEQGIVCRLRPFPLPKFSYFHKTTNIKHIFYRFIQWQKAYKVIRNTYYYYCIICCYSCYYHNVCQEEAIMIRKRNEQKHIEEHNHHP